MIFLLFSTFRALGKSKHSVVDIVMMSCSRCILGMIDLGAQRSQVKSEI